MCDKHLTDDELVARLFGVGPKGAHLENCPDCAHRWEAIRYRYENRRGTYSEVAEARLTAQRIAVDARLKDKTRKLRLILVPSFGAVAVLLLIALIVFKPTSPKQQAPDTISEDQVMEEVYQMSLSSEPEAIEPVQSLFEEQQ